MTDEDVQAPGHEQSCPRRRPSRRYVARRTTREFLSDQCIDLAAGLTFYGVLSLFPAMAVLISVLGLVGQSGATADVLAEVARRLLPAEAADVVIDGLEQLAASTATGAALALGIAVGLWSASRYVAAFGRAMNRIFEVPEGRPLWKLRPSQLLVTMAVLLLVAALALTLAVTGPVAEAVGRALGLDTVLLTLWDVLKWPVVALAAVVVIGLLYRSTPNVQHPAFRWTSPGAVTALGIWLVASIGFAGFVAGSDGYAATYGAIASGVVFLLWLWISNMALLLGAELDSELERARQLSIGEPAEEELQLDPRDTSAMDRRRRAEQRDIREGRRLRRGR